MRDLSKTSCPGYYNINPRSMAWHRTVLAKMHFTPLLLLYAVWDPETKIDFENNNCSTFNDVFFWIFLFLFVDHSKRFYSCIFYIFFYKHLQFLHISTSVPPFNYLIHWASVSLQEPNTNLIKITWKKLIKQGAKDSHPVLLLPNDLQQHSLWEHIVFLSL